MFRADARGSNMADSANDNSLEARVARLSPNQRALLEERLLQQPQSGHRLVARTLASLAITHVYGVPGQPAYDMFGGVCQLCEWSTEPHGAGDVPPPPRLRR